MFTWVLLGCSRIEASISGTKSTFDTKAIRWDGTVPSFLPELAPGGAHGALATDNSGRIVGYSTGTVDGAIETKASNGSKAGIVGPNVLI